MNLHATWDRSRRHTDRKSLLSSDEEGPILSWGKKLHIWRSRFIITPDKSIIARLSSILWIKVDLRSSNKVVHSLYSSFPPIVVFQFPMIVLSPQTPIKLKFHWIFHSTPPAITLYCEFWLTVLFFPPSITIPVVLFNILFLSPTTVIESFPLKTFLLP